jgi:hypothetical protein
LFKRDLHCLVLDGVYRLTEGEPVFQSACAPTAEQLHGLLDKIIVRVMRLLTRRGLLIEEHGAQTWAAIEADPALSPLQWASCTYRIALGPRAGQKLLTLQTLSTRTEPASPGLCAKAHGISLHAAVRCAAHQGQELEQLCRYITRPAIANARLHLDNCGNRTGQVVLRLKSPHADGTTPLAGPGRSHVRRRKSPPGAPAHMELDATDIRLLDLLQSDASRSNQDPRVAVRPWPGLNSTA